MDDDEVVVGHLKAIRGSLAVIAFVLVVQFLAVLLVVLARIADGGSL